MQQSPAAAKMSNQPDSWSVIEAERYHSYINFFLYNLHLLDLHKRSDWPSITAITYSTKDEEQNQQNRARCTEWALFRLFELFEPQRTKAVSVCARFVEKFLGSHNLIIRL